MPKTRLARRKGFHCLHKNVSPAWTDSAASSAFGGCFSPGGPGQNFELEIYIEGAPDPATGMIMNLADVDLILNEVIEPIDGKPWNFATGTNSESSSGKRPTTEIIAHYLTEKLQPRFSGAARLVKLRLYEYENLWVDVWPN